MGCQNVGHVFMGAIQQGGAALLQPALVATAADNARTPLGAAQVPQGMGMGEKMPLAGPLTDDFHGQMVFVDVDPFLDAAGR
jgi:hypothetical protein